MLSQRGPRPARYMKPGIAKGSLFAILLRSPWWMSLLAAVAIFAAVRLLTSEIFALCVSLPFIAVSAWAGWRQRRAPSPARVDETLAALRALTSDEFSAALQEAYRRDGYHVGSLAGPEADLELTKGARVALLACRRWRVARTGVEPLRALHAACRAREAHECIYLAAGEITDTARRYAAENNIRLVEGAELAGLLPRRR